MQRKNFLAPLVPALVKRPWGGERLAPLFGVGSAKEGPIGEAWSISTRKENPSFIDDRSLEEFIPHHKMSYLVKFIDTADHLSVQVHPSDFVAKEQEGDRGKSECWLILQGTKEAKVYLGLKPQVSVDSLFLKAKKGEDITSLLESYSVKEGDFFFVPAGTIHAVGKDVFLLEVSHNSDITYRIWDWNRTSAQGHSRPLHHSKAMKAINTSEGENKKEAFNIQHSLWEKKGKTTLMNVKGFNVALINLEEGDSYPIEEKRKGVISALVIVKGHGWLTNNHGEVNILPYQSYLIEEGTTIYARSNLSVVYIRDR